MNFKKNKKPVFVFILISVLISISGIILFFPANINGVHTCIYDSIMSGEAPDSLNSHQEMHRHWEEVDAMNNGHRLFKEYLIPYGLIWWASFFIAIVGIILIKE